MTVYNGQFLYEQRTGNKSYSKTLLPGSKLERNKARYFEELSTVDRGIIYMTYSLNIFRGKGKWEGERIPLKAR